MHSRLRALGWSLNEQGNWIPPKDEKEKPALDEKEAEKTA